MGVGCVWVGRLAASDRATWPSVAMTREKTNSSWGVLVSHPMTDRDWPDRPSLVAGSPRNRCSLAVEDCAGTGRRHARKKNHRHAWWRVWRTRKPKDGSRASGMDPVHVPGTSRCDSRLRTKRRLEISAEKFGINSRMDGSCGIGTLAEVPT